MAGILDLMGYIQDQSDRGRQAGLQRLVGKAYGAAPDQQQQILSTVAQRGAPDLAMSADKAFGEQQDNVHLQMAKRAAEVVALYQSNPQMAQQVYQNGLLPIARRAGVPNAPMQLDASLIPGLEKLASAANASGTPAELQTFNALTAGMPPEDIANARRIKLGIDPRAPVTQPFIFDPTRGVWVSNPGYRGDAPQAQQQPQQAPQNMPPQRMSDDQIIAMANQMTQRGVPADQVDQWVRQQQSMTQYEPAPAQAPMPQAPASQAVPVAGLPDKPQAPPTQLQLNADARDQARLLLAQQAAARAAAPKPADDMKAQKIAAARADALDSVNQAIDGIDALTKSSGFNNLGTYTGDIVGMIPHTKTRDATNALETIKNQVLLATLSKLKALSATGASGFGALSNQEGRILQNSIANLETAQSHDAIVANLKTIKETLQRAAGKIGGAATAQPSTQSSDIDGLLSKYGVK